MTTQTMLEKVARAICVERGRDPDAGDDEWQGWMNYLPHARAALQALREPTEEMESAVYNECLSQGHFVDRYTDVDGAKIIRLDGDFNITKMIRAMIDAILQERA